MAVDLKLPLLGDVMTEGTLAAWLCDDGAQVQSGQPLYRLETDKVTMDIEAPAAGTLRQLVAAGTDVPVGGLIGRLLAPGEEMAAPEAALSAPAAVVGSTQNSVLSTQPAAGDEIRATPAARRLARELGIDLTAIVQAAGGTIREEDVQSYAEQNR